MSRTVTHGIDDSGLSSAKPAKGNDGHYFYATDTNTLYVWSDALYEWLIVDTLCCIFDPTGVAADRALGPHELPGARIPAGHIVLDGLIDVITTFTSAGDTATIALRMQTANDLVSAIAINNGGDPWDAGLHNIIPAGTAATMIKASADRSVLADVGVQVLTGGKLRLFLRTARSEQTVTEEESSTNSSVSSSSSSSSSVSSSSSSSSSS